MKIPGAGKVELVYTAEDGTQTRELVHEFTGAGIVQGMHNVNESIEVLQEAVSIMHWTQNRISGLQQRIQFPKKYDHTFKDIFQESTMSEYDEKFKAAGIEYFYTLIDDAVARVIEIRGRIYLDM